MRTKIILLSLLMILSSCREGRITYCKFPDVTMSLEGGTYTIEAEDYAHIQYLIDNGTGVEYNMTSDEHEITAPGISIKVVEAKKHSQIVINVATASVSKSWTAKFSVFLNKEYSLNIKQE